MHTSEILSLLQTAGIKDSTIKGLTVVDYAFMLMRGIVVAGGFFRLTLHPFPDNLKFWLVGLFLVFIIYSLIIYGFIFTWPSKIETIYLVCLSLDLIFTGIFIKLTGGFNSIILLSIYPLVALYSFYYGFYRGMALATVASLVYIIAVYNQWGGLLWLDLIFKGSIIFLVAGFLGSLSGKMKYDKNELEGTRAKLLLFQKELEEAYKNLQDVKPQVEQSEKFASIGRLSAELAHEINNPLVA